MDSEGNIVPATNLKRSQYHEFLKRQIDESVAVKTGGNGAEMIRMGIILGGVIPFKRHVDPVILEVRAGTDLHLPVYMDASGMINYISVGIDCYREDRGGLICDLSFLGNFCVSFVSIQTEKWIG